MALIDRLRPLHAEGGLTLAEAAERLGANYSYVCKVARKHGLKFRRPSWNGPAVDGCRAKAVELKRLRDNGLFLPQAAKQLGITYACARMVAKRHEIEFPNAQLAAIHAAKERRKRALEESLDRRCLKSLGCTWRDRARIEQEADSLSPALTVSTAPLGAFQRQRVSARKRQVHWGLSFLEWWALWATSGRWPERGRGFGYAMCRVGDVGPYQIGNVFIATGSENTTWGAQKSIPPRDLQDQVRRAEEAAEAARCYLQRWASQTTPARHPCAGTSEGATHV